MLEQNVLDANSHTALLGSMVVKSVNINGVGQGLVKGRRGYGRKVIRSNGGYQCV